MMEAFPRIFDSRVQLLAVCPLLAMSDTVVDALGLSVAILIAVPVATMLLAPVRGLFSSETALSASMLALAMVVAALELLMSAWLNELRQSLALFLPLVVANLVVVGRLQRSAERPHVALLDGLRFAAGIALTLLPLSVARELVGRGSLLHDAGAFFGAWASPFEVSIFPVDMGFLLALLPPGAFIAFGLLLAARNWLVARRATVRTRPDPQTGMNSDRRK